MKVLPKIRKKALKTPFQNKQKIGVWTLTDKI
jgi:hypothetical protein